MPSVIETKTKTVNNREVIAFVKQWADEEHEVFAPKEHATQILLSVLSVVNDGKDADDRLLLVRQRDVGEPNPEPYPTNGQLKRDAVVGMARELVGEDAAADVALALNGGPD